MEILVILMLAAVFFAIAMFIVSFIMVKKHHTDKVYANDSDNLELDDDDDDDVVDNANDSVVKENNSNDNDLVKNSDEKVVTTDEVIDNEKNQIVELEKEERVLIEEINETPSEVKKEFEESPMVDIIVPKVDADNKDVVKNVETDMQEVVNVLINKKNYMFLANGNKVTKGEHIKLVLNKKIYFGLITKGNYMRDIRPLKNKPYKLIIIKSNKNKKEEIEVLDTTDLEFIPKRKSQN